MKLPFIVCVALLALSCAKTTTQDESADDTTKTSHADSIEANIQSDPNEFGYKADYYVVSESLDPSQFQLIDKSCAILIEATAAQVQAQLEQKQIEEDKKHEEWKKAKAEWEKQPHDTTEQFTDEQSYFGSDGADDVMFYQSQAQDTFEGLKIATVTIAEKGYVKLIDKNKKEWVLDIRSNMSPDWTIILFNANKEPKVVEAIDVTRERMIQYFLLKPTTEEEQSKFNSGEISGEFAMANGDCTNYCRVKITGDHLLLEGIDYSGSKSVRYSETYIRSLSDKFTFNFPKDSNVQIKLIAPNEFTFVNGEVKSCKFLKTGV